MKEFKLPHEHSDTQGAHALYTELCKSESFSAVSELFRQLSDPTRVRIFWLLSHREECVINISALLEMTAPAVSHHLKVMKDCGIIESRRDGKEVYYRIADSEECSLLHQMTEKIMKISCPARSRGESETWEETIRKVHEYLLTHLGDRITIEALSRQFHVNATTLKVKFKEIYGDSIGSHVNEHRMEKAGELLKTTSDSVLKVGQLVGFSSQSRFTTVFREYYGVTPTQYRNA